MTFFDLFSDLTEIRADNYHFSTSSPCIYYCLNDPLWCKRLENGFSLRKEESQMA